MAEWFKAAVLKTVDRKVRGFESLSLRQFGVRRSVFTHNVTERAPVAKAALAGVVDRTGMAAM